MKHKSQDALESIDADNNTYLIGHSNGYSKLKILIDCQLTEKEIGMIMNCLSIACFDEDMYNSIFEKLNKQKEMWE